MIFVNPDSKIYRHVPNVVLGYAAAIYNARVIDFNARPEPKDRFLDEETDVLCISARSLTKSESERIARLYLRKYPRAEIKYFKGILNVLCCYPFIELGEAFVYDEPFSDNYPFPNYELFDSFEIFQKNWQKGKWPYIIMTSAGCPYQCSYCLARNTKWKARSAQNCFEELKEAKQKWGIVSDVFNLDKERVLEFCRLVKPLKLRWSCANGLRADRFDEEIAKNLKEAGCNYVSFGIESIHQDVLKRIGKGEDFSVIEKAIDIAQKYFGPNVNGFFIIGLPGSSYQKDLASIAWAIRKKISATFSFYVPEDFYKLKPDQIFWGPQARPLTEEYSSHLQMKIYQMTNYMREPFSLKSAMQALKMIWKFDKKHFLGQIFSGLKRISLKNGIYF
jgi:radical SAM superfamily enzyme YgiQ (UPF0313 family)